MTIDDPSLHMLRNGACKISSSLLESKESMWRLLSDSIRRQSVSGDEKDFVEFIHSWAIEHDFETDLWEVNDQDFARAYPTAGKHLPLKGRPALVIRLSGNGSGRSLIFNAHSDVVSAPKPERWQHDPWSGDFENGRIFGRGACDAKGPLVSALWAMLAIKQSNVPLSGDVLLELIPGEEDAVGIGTSMSISRGYSADGVIVLEPTEGMPRCASRSGVRFEIACAGTAVHGTVKWLGKDAIQTIRRVLDALEKLEQRWNDKSDVLFASYSLTRPVTVDYIRGGDWQGMICDQCVCAGYLELLPADSLEEWKSKFTEELLAEIARSGYDAASLKIRFTEEYRGHRTDTDTALCISAQHVLGWSQHDWKGFNSGCEAGVRANLQNTPTLVWGPGSLAQAHANDEFVSIKDVECVAELFAAFIEQWAGDKG